MALVLGAPTPQRLSAGTPSTPGRLPSTLSTYTATGVSIPPLSLDRWFRARNNSSGERVEVVIKGDSTFAGQVAGADTVHYSPVTRIRERLASAGYTDGGHGWNNGLNDTPSVSGDTVSGISNVTGFTYGDAYALPGETGGSNAGGDKVTFSGYGPTIRLWERLFTTGGRYRYNVDGGAWTIVDPARPPIGGVRFFDFLYITGLADGLHTVTIENMGGAPVSAPSQNGLAASTAGTANPYTPSGTYYYKYTSTTAAGETLPTVAFGPVTVSSSGTPNGNTISGTLAQARGATGYKIYRATSAGGTYGLVTTVSDSGSGATGWTDSTTTPGAAPPTSDTSGLASAYSVVNVVPDFVRDVGIVLHNHAVRGGGSVGGTGEAQNLALQLGLVPDQTSTDAGTLAVDTRPGVRRPVLVIYCLGINDQQGAGGTDTSATLKANCINAGKAARAAGADFLILIPALESANQSQLAPNYRQALKDAATALNAPWVDIGMGGALPTMTAGSTGNNPHLTAAQYVTQGDFIWDNVLGVR